MGLKEFLIEKIRNFRAQKSQEEELPDDVTRDKYLRSLRRERRTQMEELEKERLKRQIAEFHKEKTRKYVFGLKQKAIARKTISKPRNTAQWLGKYKL